MAAIALIGVLLAVVFAVEYYTYTQTLTITPYKQFALGASSASWTVYVNDMGVVQYVPGGDSQPTLDTSNVDTYAFNISTDANRVCSLEIQLTTAVSASDFSSFEVSVLPWSESAWGSAVTLYAASTGLTTAPYLDGLTNTPVYLHQAVSTSTYYLVEVTYSYIGTSSSPITVEFNYTPLPLTSF